MIEMVQFNVLNVLFFHRRKVEMFYLVKSEFAFFLRCDYNFGDRRSESIGNSYAFIHQLIARSIYFARMNAKNLSDQELMDLVVPKQQLIVMRQSNEFEGLIADLAQQVRDTPDFNSQNSIVRLHYFLGGCDWWITQVDLDHRLGYGFVCLNGDWQCAEYGTVSLEELCSVNVVNIDLHWTPLPMVEVLKGRR